MMIASERGVGRMRVFARVCLVALMAVPGVAWSDTVTVRGEITTAADLNPDYQGRPSPVNLIVFQLKSPEAFLGADFFSLFPPDSPVLGEDLIRRTQIQVRPDEKNPVEWQFDEEARFIGVVAAFRDIENAEWRGLVELPERGFFTRFFRRNKMFISVEALAVSVSTENNEGG